MDFLDRPQYAHDVLIRDDESPMGHVLGGLLMRLQVVDDAVRFSCGSCTACCDQPWRTMIEASKAQALDEHDFNAYPQLAGKEFYHKSKAQRNPRHGQPDTNRPEPLYPLAKGEGTRCLFLDSDGLCIIHKELGPEAKPNMCRLVSISLRAKLGGGSSLRQLRVLFRSGERGTTTGRASR